MVSFPCRARLRPGTIQASAYTMPIARVLIPEPEEIQKENPAGEDPGRVLLSRASGPGDGNRFVRLSCRAARQPRQLVPDFRRATIFALQTQCQPQSRTGPTPKNGVNHCC